MAARPRFSVVIPAHNEAKFLPRLLDSIDAARARYRGGAQAVEVVVADNASTDDTAAVALARGCRVARVDKRVIAASRNGGAREASGEILCFVDADTLSVDASTFDVIDGLMSDGAGGTDGAGGRYVAGATGVKLERWSAGLAATWLLFMPFVIATGLDTGVVFCRRDDWLAVGGYDESRPVGEDVAFLWALKRLGRERGRRLVRATSVKAVASTRKFDEFGDWHYFTLMPRFTVSFLLGRPGARETLERYWYRPRR